MTRRLILPLLFGLAGAAILIGLGVWQMQRLAWKEAVLDGIDARIGAAPAALPAVPDPQADAFMPVRVSGSYTGEGLDVLVSRKHRGAGFRLVAVLQTDDGRRVLVDRGYLPEAQRSIPRATGAVTVTGNLHWPDEVDGFTPPPDATRNIWFARDLPAMAQALDAEPVLVVQRGSTYDDAPVEPMPLDSATIPNDHLNYAITWFLLAAGWLAMTVLLIVRLRRQGRAGDPR